MWQAPPTDLTSALRQDGGARTPPRRLPPHAETEGRLRAAPELKSRPARCGVRVRWCASLPREACGEGAPMALAAVVRGVATWEGRSWDLREGRTDWGASGQVGGVQPRVPRVYPHG